MRDEALLALSMGGDDGIGPTAWLYRIISLNLIFFEK
jgi:hypothetical protein